MALENNDNVNSIIDKAGKAGPGGAEGASADDIKVKITLWKNGFSVDEGEFRDYNAPGSKEFMD